MPELWDNLTAAQQPPPAPDMWNAPMGVGSPAETAGAPSLMSLLGKYFAPKPRDENSPVEYKTASPMVNITTQDIADATDKALAFSGGGLGIKAYHSSPHDFDRFDLSKIGTGEGAQVYGHGLYFAENPAVSGQGGQYWDQFRNRFSSSEASAAERLKNLGFDRAKAIEEAHADIATARHGISRAPDGPVGDYWKTVLAQHEAELPYLTSGQPVGPRTYEVNINADPAHFLDWDKPLREQGRVGEAFSDVVPKPGWWSRQMGDMNDIRHSIATDPERSGGAAYGSLARMLDQPRASAMLNEAGIPGIKYLDQGSRGNAFKVELSTSKGPYHDQTFSTMEQAKQFAADKEKEGFKTNLVDQGSRNYVVWDPSIIDIMKKYGIAGTAPLAAGFGFPPVGNEQRM